MKTTCVSLHDAHFAQLEQCISIASANHPDSIKLTSVVRLTGLSMSVRRNPVSTSVELLPDRRIRYYSTVAWQWYLLTWPIYTDHETFTGVIKLDRLQEP